MNYQEKLKERRYKNSTSKKPIDSFMQAWTLMLAANNAGVNWLNKKKLSKELQQFAEDFFLTDYQSSSDEERGFIEAEWQDFALSFIEKCAGSKAYCSTLFGLVHITDSGVAIKLATEIDNVLIKYPSCFNMKETFLPLYNVFKSVFFTKFENAEQIWNSI